LPSELKESGDENPAGKIQKVGLLFGRQGGGGGTRNLGRGVVRITEGRAFTGGNPKENRGLKGQFDTGRKSTEE